MLATLQMPVPLLCMHACTSLEGITEVWQ